LKILYRARRSKRSMPDPEFNGDFLELLYDNWNDFGFQTYFETHCRINGKVIELGAIRLLIDHEDQTFRYLNRMLQNGWSGEFPIPDTDYVSVPSEISFYEQISALLGEQDAISVAQRLRDASYFITTCKDPKAIELSETQGFQKSLLRERGSIKSYLDGWKVLAGQTLSVMDLAFQFYDVFGDVSKINLKFQSSIPLPHDINVLIGPNGVGKSQLLKQIVRDWLEDEIHEDPDEDQNIGFVKKPNLSQIIVVSYSPFEKFPVDLEGRKKQDLDVYRYFGFRERSTRNSHNKRGKIIFSKQAPNINTANSLVSCLSDDKRYSSVPGWPQKLKTAEDVLRTAFEFDFAAVSVSSLTSPSTFYEEDDDDILTIEDHLVKPNVRYIPVSSNTIEKLNDKALARKLLAEEGVTFFKGRTPIELSSGQRLFTYIVLNVLGAIRRDSLILIDEPELFLHPNLEIQFIDMLKEILQHFNSKALLATHSVVTVREVPAACVHVFEKTREGLRIKQPPFQTFGGDLQRITSYVFGDRSVSKPFQRWIAEQLSQRPPEVLIQMLGDDINEELIIQIKALGRELW